MPSKIFINYRTGDGHDAAQLLDAKLCEVFGKKRVFRDRRSMPPGTEYPREMRRNLAESNVLLAIIGPHWLTLREKRPDGRRLIDIPGDWVHEEIRASLGVRTVIPVLIGGLVTLPAADELPKALRKLGHTQPHPLRPHHAHLDVEALIKTLKDHVPVKRKKPREQTATSTPTVRAGGNAQVGNGNTMTGETHVTIDSTQGAVSVHGPASVTNNNGVAPKPARRKAP